MVSRPFWLAPAPISPWGVTAQTEGSKLEGQPEESDLEAPQQGRVTNAKAVFVMQM